MDLSYFEVPYESLVSEATYDSEGIEISPAVYETLYQRKTAPPEKTLAAVERVIKKHNASNDKAIRPNVERYLDSRQWVWLAEWEAWKTKHDEDTAWNAEFAGMVSHTESVRVIDDAETGESHFEDQDVLHEARALEVEPVRPELLTVDQWININLKEPKRQALKSERDKRFMSVAYNFGDGRVMQVRVIDKENIEQAISQGVDRRWVMADNVPKVVTVNELQSALDYGVTEANSIWDWYMNELEILL